MNDSAARGTRVAANERWPDGAGIPPRLRIYVVDTRTKPLPSAVLHANLDELSALQSGDPLFLLSVEQSQQMVEQDRALAGKEPVVIVHDLTPAAKKQRDQVHGFRLHLGLVKDREEAEAAMREFLNLIAMHRNAKSLTGRLSDRAREAIEIQRAAR